MVAIRDALTKALLKALEKARSHGEIEFCELPRFIVERPPHQTFGDYATNIAMMLGKELKRDAKEIADIILKHLDLDSGLVERVEVAGTGFINFYLRSDWLCDMVRQAVAEDERFGHSNIGDGQTVQVEFVSANPTGPLHLGHGRGGVLGDVIARLLSAVGFKVHREFYINDAATSTQMRKFGQSLEVRYLQSFGHPAQMPEDGYKGEYVVDIASEIRKEFGDKYLHIPSGERVSIFTQLAMEKMLARQRAVLERFGINMDSWVSEQWLYDGGRVREAIERLINSGWTYEQDEAIWLRTTSFGDDKDRVLVRSDGTPTYLAADVAYHIYKYERGFKSLINIWGPDHHGYVARLKAALKALGYDVSKMHVIVYQIVRLFKDGELVPMGKREGEMITLEELLDWAGVDAVRFFLLMRSADSPIDFDVTLATKQSQENPVYYVQYAHARACSIFKQASIDRHPALTVPKDKVNLSLLTHSSEQLLMREVAELLDIVSEAALRYEPHRLTSYAHQLATAFHSFYTSCRVLGDDEMLSAARLMLTDAARIAIRNTLALMGVSAPTQM
ncbi:MAG: arginine--tRNA ligase [Armatimonadota bacterium]|nr:arginine--tRNA ligase [Armatimonadota bacterium]MCX7777131.1 arginine--tRNA ligase [Armatimonadota bacterium]MDW8025178.1 arginine--tRNA ligase [Armatimonadota bacterium]